MKIILAKNLEAAKSLEKPYLSVEAEYGDTVVEGWAATLAHHVPGWTSAPALCEFDHLEKNKVDVFEEHVCLISHIDLDVIVGISHLLGIQDFSWESKDINYVDCNGQHTLFSEHVSEMARKVIIAYVGYASINRAPFSPKEDIMDVTEYVMSTIQNFNTEYYYSVGLKLITDRKEEAERSLLLGLNGVALIEQAEDSKVFGLNSEYTIKNNVYDYVIVYSNKFKSVTVSAKDGNRQKINLAEFMQGIFGNEAGGHAGIAGTPRGAEFSIDDAWRVFSALQEASK